MPVLMSHQYAPGSNREEKLELPRARFELASLAVSHRGREANMLDRATPPGPVVPSGGVDIVFWSVTRVKTAGFL